MADQPEAPVSDREDVTAVDVAWLASWAQENIEHSARERLDQASAARILAALTRRPSPAETPADGPNLAREAKRETMLMLLDALDAGVPDGAKHEASALKRIREFIATEPGACSLDGSSAATPSRAETPNE